MLMLKHFKFQPCSPSVLAFAIVALSTAKSAEHVTQLDWGTCARSPHSLLSAQGRTWPTARHREGAAMCSHAEFCTSEDLLHCCQRQPDNLASLFLPRFSAPKAHGRSSLTHKSYAVRGGLSLWKMHEWLIKPKSKIRKGKHSVLSTLLIYRVSFMSQSQPAEAGTPSPWAALCVCGMAPPGWMSVERKTGMRAPAAWTQPLVWIPYVDDRHFRRETMKLRLKPRSCGVCCQSWKVHCIFVKVEKWEHIAEKRKYHESLFDSYCHTHKDCWWLRDLVWTWQFM